MLYNVVYCISSWYIIVQTPDVNQGLAPVKPFGQFPILFVSKLIHGSDHTNSNTFKDKNTNTIQNTISNTNQAVWSIPNSFCLQIDPRVRPYKYNYIQSLPEAQRTQAIESVA